MSKITKYVGLDVHKDSISIAIAEEGRSEPKFLKRALDRSDKSTTRDGICRTIDQGNRCWGQCG